VWVDEAHHVKNASRETLNEESRGSNGLGELVAFLLSRKAYGVQIGLTTATFFRGDRYTLITEEMEKQFRRFNLPYDEYLRSLKHLRSFSFTFLLCGLDYTKAFDAIVRTKRKDIIYIPHPTSQHATCHKLQGVKNIVETYKSVHGGEIVDSHGALIHLSGGSAELKIIDLVNEQGRDQKKEFLNSPRLKEDRDSLDVVITLGMFKEGANWIFAERCVIVGPRSSLVDSVQMIGRLLRDAEGKDHVEVVQLLPFSLDPGCEDYQENLNNYLKAIFASLILEDILRPVKIKVPVAERKNEAREEDEVGNRRSLRDIIPEESLNEIMGRVVALWAIINEQSEHAQSNVFSRYDAFQKGLSTVLEEYGLSDHTKEIGGQLWKMALRRAYSMRGLDVENIDFELLKELDPLKDGLFQGYISGKCDALTFEEFRKAVQLSRPLSGWKPFEEVRRFVRSLKLESETHWRLYIDGQLPHLRPLPLDIPCAPWVIYKNSGWVSMGDFLGTGVVAPRLREYLPYEDARTFARENLSLRRKEDWCLYVKGAFPKLPPLPDDIPATPDRTYRREKYGKKWAGWGDFLGTERVSNQDKSKKHPSFTEARRFARRLKLTSYAEWKRYLKGEFPRLLALPTEFPHKPDQVYKNRGWNSWPDFLGSSSKYDSTKKFQSFEKARSFVQTLHLRSQKEWQEYCANKRKDLPKKPKNIPSNPQKTYNNQGWQRYPDWLGYGG
jgi:hypothetical protein